MSPAELLMSIHLTELDILYNYDIQFDTERKWRLDFYLPEYRVGIEIDGYFKGRHGAGWGADNEKRNSATMQGIRVLVFSTKDVLRGKAKEWIAQWLLGLPSPSYRPASSASRPKARARGKVPYRAAK